MATDAAEARIGAGCGIHSGHHRSPDKTTDAVEVEAGNSERHDPAQVGAETKIAHDDIQLRCGEIAVHTVVNSVDDPERAQATVDHHLSHAGERGPVSREDTDDGTVAQPREKVIGLGDVTQ